MCSLIPILIGYPEPWLMGDAVLCLTMVELMMVSLALWSILKGGAALVAGKVSAAVQPN